MRSLLGTIGELGMIAEVSVADNVFQQLSSDFVLVQFATIRGCYIASSIAYRYPPVWDTHLTGQAEARGAATIGYSQSGRLVAS